MIGPASERDSTATTAPFFRVDGPVLLPVGMAVVAAALLAATVEPQIYDTNFYSLWQATAVMAGDHPYRDFFEWGIPLQVGASIAGQWASGRRLLGEFAIQWCGIAAGIAVTTVLARRVSGSRAALVTMAVAVLSVIATSTYHYPKLLFYPLALWAGWRYFDRPGLARAACAGVVTGLAFLFRHDHGIYAGLASTLVFIAAVLSARAPGARRLMMRHVAAYAAALGLAVLPWALLVQSGEGLIPYFQQRLAFYSGVTSVSGQFFGPAAPLRRLLTTNPLVMVSLPAVVPGGAPETAWWPDDISGQRALEEIALLVPVLLLVAVALDAWRSRGERLRAEAWLTAASSLFLLVLDNQLFREPTYALTVLPVTLALGSQLLTRGRLASVGFGGMLILTVIAVLGVLRATPIARPVEFVTERTPRAYRELLTTPAIDAFITREAAETRIRENGGDAWGLGTLTEGRHPLLRYLHDCTTPRDRVWIAGSTPFHVGYLIERRIAGGHIFWQQGWRSDPDGEAESLRLLQTSSVPFFFSANEPILDGLRAYPRIRAHLLEHYDALADTNGRVFVERGRTPTGVFGPGRFPCFAAPRG